jgi:hypothetical protein
MESELGLVLAKFALAHADKHTHTESHLSANNKIDAAVIVIDQSVNPRLHVRDLAEVLFVDLSNLIVNITCVHCTSC